MIGPGAWRVYDRVRDLLLTSLSAEDRREMVTLDARGVRSWRRHEATLKRHRAT